MQLSASASPYEAIPHKSAWGYAKHLATYVSDPSRIRSIVLMDYGTAPTVERCAQYRAEHLASEKRFSDEANKPKGYKAENDNGEHFQVKGIVPPKPKPKPKLKPEVIDRRIAVLARERDKNNAERKAKAIKAGPIARGIIRRTAKWFNLNYADMIGDDRRLQFVLARYVAVRLIYDVKDAKGEPRFSKSQIGRIMGGRDHTTIIHALRIFDGKARAYPAIAEAYAALRHG